uniref:Metalloendopeptidase n=1 Tax=Acrobeloides nanus TaxID=290746 RepID=A0A914CV83_9BILA
MGSSVPIYEINEKSSNSAILYGDVLISPKQLQLRKLNDQKDVTIKEKHNNRWTNNIIPYILSSQYSEREKSLIKGAFAQLAEKSCFRFVERTTQRDYLDIKKLGGCFSYVGKIGGRQLISLGDGCVYDFIIWHEVLHVLGGRQLISLGDGCVYDFIIWHEVLHVLGLEHEHQRPDRDNHIKVIYQNVEPDKMANFEKIPYDQVDLNGHPYDYKSIMHYDGSAFGKYDKKTGRRLVTMVPLKAGVELVDNYELTELDFEKLRILGKCHERENKSLSVCRDKFPNCLQIKSDGLCENSFYKGLIEENCRLTCGICSHLKGFQAEAVCIDKHENCDEYIKLGFCSSTSYKANARELCAKSCGFC